MLPDLVAVLLPGGDAWCNSDWWAASISTYTLQKISAYGRNNEARARAHCNVGPGFIIPSIYGYFYSAVERRWAGVGVTSLPHVTVCHSLTHVTYLYYGDTSRPHSTTPTSTPTRTSSWGSSHELQARRCGRYTGVTELNCTAKRRRVVVCAVRRNSRS